MGKKNNSICPQDPLGILTNIRWICFVPRTRFIEEQQNPNLTLNLEVFTSAKLALRQLGWKDSWPSVLWVLRCLSVFSWKIKSWEGWIYSAASVSIACPVALSTVLEALRGGNKDRRMWKSGIFFYYWTPISKSHWNFSLPSFSSSSGPCGWQSSGAKPLEINAAGH